MFFFVAIEEGNIGIIYHVNSSQSLDAFKSRNSGDYILVLEIKFFTRFAKDLLLKFVFIFDLID